MREIFEQIALRVVGQWEYDDAIEAKRLHMQEASTGASEPSRRGSICIWAGVGVDRRGRGRAVVRES